MLEGPACPHIPPPTQPASKHVISYHWVCVSISCVHIPRNQPQPLPCTVGPLFAWYLNLEKVINSYAIERSAPPSKGWIFG